jgi:hypothetical protein
MADDVEDSRCLPHEHDKPNGIRHIQNQLLTADSQQWQGERQNMGSANSQDDTNGEGTRQDFEHPIQEDFHDLIAPLSAYPMQ